jgi:hypothetical protein
MNAQACIDDGVQWTIEAVLDFVKLVLTYCAALCGGVLLAMTVSAYIGYLPYSDRPGPGWYGPRLLPLDEVAYYLEFATLLLSRVTAIAAVTFFLLARVLGALRLPKWAIAAYGALTIGLVSLIAVAAAGWYIAVGAFAVYAGGVIGLLYGILVLPRFAHPLAAEGRRWWHWVLSPLAPAAILWLVLFPH